MLGLEFYFSKNKNKKRENKTLFEKNYDEKQGSCFVWPIFSFVCFWCLLPLLLLLLQLLFCPNSY